MKGLVLFYNECKLNQPDASIGMNCFEKGIISQPQTSGYQLMNQKIIPVCLAKIYRDVILFLFLPCFTFSRLTFKILQQY